MLQEFNNITSWICTHSITKANLVYSFWRHAHYGGTIMGHIFSYCRLYLYKAHCLLRKKLLKQLNRLKQIQLCNINE